MGRLRRPLKASLPIETSSIDASSKKTGKLSWTCCQNSENPTALTHGARTLGPLAMQNSLYGSTLKEHTPAVYHFLFLFATVNSFTWS